MRCQGVTCDVREEHMRCQRGTHVMSGNSTCAVREELTHEMSESNTCCEGGTHVPGRNTCDI